MGKLSGQNDPEFDPSDLKRDPTEPQKTMFHGGGAEWKRFEALPEIVGFRSHERVGY